MSRRAAQHSRLAPRALLSARDRTARGTNTLRRGASVDTSRHPLIDTAKPATTPASCGSLAGDDDRGFDRRVKFRAPAPGAAIEHVRVVEQSVEQHGHRRGIAERISPVIHRRLQVRKVDARSYRCMINSSRSSDAVGGSLRVPRSTMIRRGTVLSAVKTSLRVPSSVASVSPFREALHRRRAGVV